MKNKIVLFIFILLIIIFINNYCNAQTLDISVDIPNVGTYTFDYLNGTSTNVDISNYSIVAFKVNSSSVEFLFLPKDITFSLVENTDPNNSPGYYFIVANSNFSYIYNTISDINDHNLYFYDNATYVGGVGGYTILSFYVNINSIDSLYSSFNFDNDIEHTFNNQFSVIGDIQYSPSGGSGGSDVNNNTVSNDVNNNTVSNDVNTNTVTNSVVIDYSDILGRIDNTTQSTNSIVNGIDTSILEIQNTLNDSWNTQDNIDNNVNEIKSILQSQNSNEVINEIQTSSNTTQQYIQNQTQQSATQFNTITDTNNYNQNSVSIDTSWNDISDVNGVDNFINQVTQLLYNYFYGLSNDVAITASFPMPYNQGQVTVSTESITRFYNNFPPVSYLTTMFWYVVFGLYIFRLAYTLWISSVDGTIFRDTEGIVARIDDNNIIKYFML